MIHDPWSELGLSTDASDEEIRRRYRELVKMHPPDRDPERFERLRDAYSLIEDPQRRATMALLGPAPLADLSELRQRLQSRRKPVPARLWLEVLKDLR
ncbi:MAG: J domain-containing protein [Planctomycetota bacterium]